MKFTVYNTKIFYKKKEFNRVSGFVHLLSFGAPLYSLVLVNLDTDTFEVKNHLEIKEKDETKKEFASLWDVKDFMLKEFDTNLSKENFEAYIDDFLIKLKKRLEAKKDDLKEKGGHYGQFLKD